MKAILLASAIAALTPAAALARDPCTAPLPTRAGETFSGQVRHIIDGDGFCVSASADPATWIEVRTADFNAPELNTHEGHVAKRIAHDLIFGRAAECVITADPRNGYTITYDRVAAVCTIDGRRFGDAMRAAGAPEGGR